MPSNAEVSQALLSLEAAIKSIDENDQTLLTALKESLAYRAIRAGKFYIEPQEDGLYVAPEDLDPFSPGFFVTTAAEFDKLIFDYLEKPSN